MTNAAIDQNSVKTLIGTLQSDGQTIVRIKVNPSTGALKISDGTSGTASSRITASRDENGHTSLMGVSSADGVTPILIAVDSSGNILTKST